MAKRTGLVGRRRFSSSQLTAIVALAAGLATYVFLSLASTDVPTLSLSPPSATVNQGDVFTVSVVLNPAGKAITAVSTKVNYSTTQLQLISTSYPSSSGVPTQATEFTGIIVLTPPVSLGAADSKIIEKLTFKAVTGGSAASLTIDTASKVYNTALPIDASIAIPATIDIKLPAVPPISVPPVTLPPIPPVTLPPVPPVTLPPVTPPVTPPATPPATQPAPPPAASSKSTTTTTPAVSKQVAAAITPVKKKFALSPLGADPKGTLWDTFANHPIATAFGAMALVGVIELGIKYLLPKFMNR